MNQWIKNYPIIFPVKHSNVWLRNVTRIASEGKVTELPACQEVSLNQLDSLQVSAMLYFMSDVSCWLQCKPLYDKLEHAKCLLLVKQQIAQRGCDGTG